MQKNQSRIRLVIADNTRLRFPPGAVIVKSHHDYCTRTHRQVSAELIERYHRQMAPLHACGGTIARLAARCCFPLTFCTPGSLVACRACQLLQPFPSMAGSMSASCDSCRNHTSFPIIIKLVPLHLFLLQPRRPRQFFSNRHFGSFIRSSLFRNAHFRVMSSAISAHS